MNDRMNELIDELKEKFDFWEDEIEDSDIMDFSEYNLKDFLENEESFSLYRYYPPTYYGIRNLETETIHLSENGVMNDIYEALPSGDVENIDHIERILFDLAYMTCFTQRNNNLLMWSHYADSHRGFCVEYALKQPLIQNKELRSHLFPVIYDKIRPITRDIQSLIDSHKELCKAEEENAYYEGEESLDDILPLCIMKSKDWEYEEEWRLVYTKKQLYDANCEFNPNVDFPYTANVYLGYRIEKSMEEHILEIVERKNMDGRNISVYKEKLDEKGYDILFDKIL